MDLTECSVIYWQIELCLLYYTHYIYFFQIYVVSAALIILNDLLFKQTNFKETVHIIKGSIKVAFYNNLYSQKVYFLHNYITLLFVLFFCSPCGEFFQRVRLTNVNDCVNLIFLAHEVATDVINLT